MPRPLTAATAVLLLLALACGSAPAPAAEEDFAAWPVLPSRFPSTGGGGFVIGEYAPVVIGDRCVTAFSTTAPDGSVSRNLALFEAVPAQGGVLCTQGRWGAADGSATGTTPLRVFLRDGVQRGAP